MGNGEIMLWNWWTSCLTKFLKIASSESKKFLRNGFFNIPNKFFGKNSQFLTKISCLPYLFVKIPLKPFQKALRTVPAYERIPYLHVSHRCPKTRDFAVKSHNTHVISSGINEITTWFDEKSLESVLEQFWWTSDCKMF